MPAPSVRILFLSDTHLGIDLPARPRVERRRRGDDFFDAFARALAPALSGEAGLVVHGGDLFFRSKVPAWLADEVYGRLADVADAGADVVLVPGNHERGSAPRPLLLTHPRVRVFDVPRTFVVSRDGVDVALSGFPYSPAVRAEFPRLLAATGHAEADAGVKLLCLHQLVEGAQVGPSDFTFRSGDDVLPGAAIPPGFAAVLAGHVHRAQVLECDLAGRPLACPVLFPGSIDRTSFAERDEKKGFLVLDVAPGDRPGGRLLGAERRELPTRPMVDVALPVAGASGPEVTRRLLAALASLDSSSVVRLRLDGEPLPEALPALRAEALRAAAPATMNVSLAFRPRLAEAARPRSLRRRAPAHPGR